MPKKGKKSAAGRGRLGLTRKRIRGTKEAV
jgi:hypothetical protein